MKYFFILIITLVIAYILGSILLTYANRLDLILITYYFADSTFLKYLFWGVIGLIVGGGIGFGGGLIETGRMGLGIFCILGFGILLVIYPLLFSIDRKNPQSDIPTSQQTSVENERYTPQTQTINLEEAYEKCEELFHKLKFEDAIRWCEEAVKIGSTSFDPHHRLAWIEFELGYTEKAFSKSYLLEGLARSDVEKLKVMILRAAIFTMGNRLDEAKSILKRAIGMDKTKENEALYRLAIIEKKDVPKEWIMKIIPGYVCWAKKGEMQANEYLRRRGIFEPKLFLRGLRKIDKKTRDRLEQDGLEFCPW